MCVLVGIHADTQQKKSSAISLALIFQDAYGLNSQGLLAGASERYGNHQDG